jgi:hypothetical protein
MESTGAFAERVRRRYASILDAARTNHTDEDAAREAAIVETAKAMVTDGYFGMTQKDVRRLVMSRG